MDSDLLFRIDNALNVKNEIENLLLLAEYYITDAENVTYKKCEETLEILRLTKKMLVANSSEFLDLLIMDQTDILQKKTEIFLCKKDLKKQARQLKKMFEHDRTENPIRFFSYNRQVLSEL